MSLNTPIAPGVGGGGHFGLCRVPKVGRSSILEREVETDSSRASCDFTLAVCIGVDYGGATELVPPLVKSREGGDMGNGIPACFR